MIYPRIGDVTLARKIDNSPVQFISKHWLDHLQAVNAVALDLIACNMRSEQARQRLAAMMARST